MSTRARVRRRALIVGFSVEGMALAMFLKRVGFEPAVYARESRSEPRDRPESFVEISAMGIDVLRTLGVLPDALAAGALSSARVFENHRGRTLGSVDEAVVVIRRDALWLALRDAAVARSVTIDFGKALEHVESAADGAVHARFADGSEERADVLVGCDGTFSRTRSLALPHAPAPRYTGIVYSAGITPGRTARSASGNVRLTFGREGFFGYQVMPGGATRWFETFVAGGQTVDADLRTIADPDWQTRLLAIHRLDPAPIPEIIAATRGPVHRRAVFDLEAMSSWHSGAIGLIGDAAHPTPPEWADLSLGLEDAATLARCLRDLPDASRALAAFEAARKPVVEYQVREAWRRMHHEIARSSLGRRLRDLVLPVYLKRAGALPARPAHLDFATRAA